LLKSLFVTEYGIYFVDVECFVSFRLDVCDHSCGDVSAKQWCVADAFLLKF